MQEKVVQHIYCSAIISKNDAERAFIRRYDGELLHMVAAFNASPELKEWSLRHPIRPGREIGSGRAALERRTIHIPDVRADPEHTYRGDAH